MLKKIETLVMGGAIKEELLSELQIDNKAYQDLIQKLPQEMRNDIRKKLISNKKKKQKMLMNISSHENSAKDVAMFTGTTLEESVNILDTSYLSLNGCCYENISNGHITPLVFEQLVVAHNNGSAKTCKLFHMILERSTNIFLVQKVDMKNVVCPNYEDKADFEMLEYAKALKEAGQYPVIWTADKVLALRCQQQELGFKFFSE